MVGRTLRAALSFRERGSRTLRVLEAVRALGAWQLARNTHTDEAARAKNLLSHKIALSSKRRFTGARVCAARHKVGEAFAQAGRGSAYSCARDIDCSLPRALLIHARRRA